VGQETGSGKREIEGEVEERDGSGEIGGKEEKGRNRRGPDQVLEEIDAHGEDNFECGVT